MKHFLTFMLLGAALAVRADYDPAAYYAQVLESHRVPTNTEGLRTFLKELAPRHPGEDPTKGLLKQLASEAYSDRVHAAAALSRHTPFPKEALDRAAQGDDPDLRRYAREILVNRKSEFDYRTYAALEYIAAKPVTGLALELAQLLPSCPETNQRVALRFALAASTQPGDEQTLKQLLRAADADGRIMAIHAFAVALPDAAPAAIRPCLEDSDPRVQLEAAARLAQNGSEQGFEALVDLLGHTRVNVRGQSAFFLRLLSGRAFGFSCYDQADNRGSAQARWRQWFNEQKGEFVITGDLAEHYVFTRNVVSLFDNNEVLELDLEGKVVSRIAGPKHPWAVHLLPNGHKLVSWQDANRHLVEYDLAGREIWRSGVMPSQPRSIEMMDDGRLWMTCNKPPKICIFDRAFGEKRERPFDPGLGQLKDGVRMPGGGMLLVFTDRGLVREIDNNSIIKRDLGNLKVPLSVQALPGRHVLVSERDARRVVEFGPDSKVTWELALKEKPCRAQRMVNGNTLVSTYTDLRVYNPAGDMLWRWDAKGPARAWRF